MNKSKKRVSFLRLIRQCDYFGVPICFIMGKEFVYRSKFSGSISLILGLTFFIILRQFEKQILLILRSVVEINYIQTQEGNPQVITLGENNVYPILQIIQPFSDKHYIIPKWEYITKEFFINGTQTKKVEIMETKFCSLDDFINTNLSISSDQQSRLIDELQRAKIEKWICPKSMEYKIAGTYGLSVFRYIKLSFEVCINEDGCISQEEYNRLLDQDEDKISIQIIFVNIIATPENKENYKNFYLERDKYFEYNFAKQFLSANIFFRKFEQQTYDNYFSSSKSSGDSWIYNDPQDFKEQRFANGKMPQNGQEIGEIYFRRSQFTKSCSRHFENIIKVLSQVGGLLQIVVISISVFLKLYNEYSLLKHLANTSYNFISQVYE